MKQNKISSLFDLTDKNIVITGSAGLLGSQYAYTLSEAGANVILIDVNKRENIKLEKFLKQKLIEDKADPKIIDHITTLQKELSERIENTGYYGEGEAEKTPIGKALSEAYGYVKDLKRKKNAKGGMIDKTLTGRSRYI